MKEFYFTYGTSETMPYQKGWTKVNAETRSEAIKAFRYFHPDHIEGLINCCSIYERVSMEVYGMLEKGNFGVFCHEAITATKNCLLREVFTV